MDDFPVIAGEDIIKILNGCSKVAVFKVTSSNTGEIAEKLRGAKALATFASYTTESELNKLKLFISEICEFIGDTKVAWSYLQSNKNEIIVIAGWY